MTAKRIALAVSMAVLLAAGYLLAWPTPVDPAAYHPPKAPPLVGPLAPNRLLASAERLGKGLRKPEDVAFASDGSVVTSCEDGRIVRILPDGEVKILVRTGGRPLGLAYDRGGNLIVCDAYKGLLRVDLAGRITTLATGAGGRPFRLTNHLAIASDGKVYFSDASSKYPVSHYEFDLLEHRPHGRLLVYDPKTSAVGVLVDGLHFANGVALSKNEHFVLVAESFAYRIWRYWLKGARAGTKDVFLDNLPGFADNMAANGAGTIWLAMFTPRNAVADWLHPRPFLKKITARLPKWLRPKAAPHTFVMAFDERGRVLGSLHDPQGERLRAVTCAVERGGFLYMGSLVADFVGRVPVPRFHVTGGR